MTPRPKRTVAGAPPPARRSRRYAALRYAVLCGSASFVYACSHAWDDYDPRLTGGPTSGSSSASASSSGAADGGVCTPNATMPCYLGPANTENNLPCHGGVYTCGADGVWGTDCAGQVLPTLEDCTNTLDDDCNGVVNDHCALWSIDFGTSGSSTGNQLYGTAATPLGAVVVVGTSRGSPLGPAEDGGVVLLDASTGVFTVALDNDGGTAAAERYGGSTSAATAVGVDGDGGTILGGIINSGQIVNLPNLPAMKSTATSEWEAFLARLAGQAGVWQALFDPETAGGYVQVNDLAWSGGPRAFLAGTFDGTADFGLAADAGADAGPDAGDAGAGDVLLTTKSAGGFVVGLNVAGAEAVTAWQTDIGTSTQLYAVAESPAGVVSPGGVVIVGGAYNDSPLKLAGMSLKGTGVFSGLVVTLDATTGAPRWAVGYPSIQGAVEAVHVDSLAVDDKEVLVAGRFAGPIDFSTAAADLFDGGADAGPADAGAGCGVITPGAEQGASDLFVARLHIADLSCVWVKTFTSMQGFDGPPGALPFRGQGVGPQIAVIAGGTAVVSANFAASATIGNWTVMGGGSSILLMALDPFGTVSWVRSFGDAHAYVTAMAVDPAGEIFLAGGFNGDLQLQPERVLHWPASAGHDGLFVAKIRP